MDNKTVFKPIHGAPVYVDDTGTRLTFITVNGDGVFRLQVRYCQNPATYEATVARLEGKTRYTSAHACQQCGGTEFNALPVQWNARDSYGAVRRCTHCHSNPKNPTGPRWRRDSLVKQVATVKLLTRRAYGRKGRAYEHKEAM